MSKMYARPVQLDRHKLTHHLWKYIHGPHGYGTAELNAKIYVFDYISWLRIPNHVIKEVVWLYVKDV
jgi:hypothetical protein